MGRVLFIFAMAIILGVFSSPEIGAREAAPPKGEAHPAHPDTPKGEHPEGSEGGLFKGFVDLTLWTIVVFLVLLFFLSKLAWRPLIDALDKRERSIAAAMEEARQAKEDAQRLREQFNRQMQEANQQVAALLEEGRRATQKAAEEMLNRARAEIQADRDRLRRELDLARDQALQEIFNRAAELAVQVSARILPRHLNDDDQRRLVEEALNDLQQVAGEMRESLKRRES